MWKGRQESGSGIRLQGVAGLHTEREPWVKERRWLLEAGKGKVIDLPWSFQKEHCPANPLWTSDLQNCKVINWCCLKPICLRQFAITATIGNSLPGPQGLSDPALLMSQTWESLSPPACSELLLPRSHSPTSLGSPRLWPSLRRSPWPDTTLPGAWPAAPLPHAHPSVPSSGGPPSAQGLAVTIPRPWITTQDSSSASSWAMCPPGSRWGEAP